MLLPFAGTCLRPISPGGEGEGFKQEAECPGFLILGLLPIRLASSHTALTTSEAHAYTEVSRS